MARQKQTNFRENDNIIETKNMIEWGLPHKGETDPMTRMSHTGETMRQSLSEVIEYVETLGRTYGRQGVKVSVRVVSPYEIFVEYPQMNDMEGNPYNLSVSVAETPRTFEVSSMRYYPHEETFDQLLETLTGRTISVRNAL